ncbi:MAG: DUF4340 domain-containing protein [Spirochaetota bacterium]
MISIIKNKRIAVSLGVIAILALYLVFSGKDKKSGDVPDVKKLDAIDEILILKKDKQIKLSYKDNKWLINEQAYPADKQTVEKLEKDMKELEITDFISKGPYYTKYDLMPEQAVKVVVKNKGKTERDILIGKTSSTNRNTYVKFAGDEKVYLASGNLPDDFNKDVEELRDKQIYKVGKDEVLSFELLYNGRLSFEKKTEEVDEKDNMHAKEKDKDKSKEKKKIKTEKWICKEFPGIEMDKNKVDSFVNSISSVRADSFTDINKKDLSGVICQIKTKVYGKEIELKVHKKDKDNYLCTSSESPYVFILREGNTKRFFKTLSDFKQDMKPGKKAK